MDKQKSKSDPLSFSHLLNPMSAEKTVCGLDANSSLDIKDTIEGVTCNECQAVFTKPENYRQTEIAEPVEVKTEPVEVKQETSEPDQPAEQPAEQPEPESADPLIHYSALGDLPACLSATCKAVTTDRSKVNCSACREIIGTLDKMESLAGADGVNIIVLNISSKTINEFLSNLFSSLSVQ